QISSLQECSLFIIQQLLVHNITPICVTTSKWKKEEIEKIAPCSVELLQNIMGSNAKKTINQNITHVFDPFFDMNIEYGMHFLQTSGTYITCGLRDQPPFPSINSSTDKESTLRGALAMSIMKNISILGNCLGVKEDLESAVSLHGKHKKMNVIIDSKYELHESINFIRRTFFDPSKFGKCVISL
ncbi:hypothetical protein AJ85_07375, partial [Alkalihalobacillus alcalophilus ATCC 27647 = CGMCC 1.3604]